MKLLSFYVWRTIKEIGLALIFAAVIIVGTVAIAAGVRSCWQCQKFGYVSAMRKHWTWHDRKKPVDVCADCADLLKEFDPEGFAE